MHPFTLSGSGGRPVRGEVRLPDGTDAPVPVVVLVHGFKGFRRWGFWPAVQGALTEAGFAAVGFDMSHNGVGTGGLEFDEPELFEANTWSREEHDLDAVLAALRAGELPHATHLDAERVALLGHSRGGGLVIGHAADDPGLRAVVGLAPVATVLRFDPETLAAGRENGFIPIRNMRTGQVLNFGRSAVAEIDARTDLHDIASAHAARLTAPLLVCHGTADPAVPHEEGARLAAAAPDGALVSFEGADHVLDCRHPFAGPTPHLERFLTTLTEFLRTHLRR